MIKDIPRYEGLYGADESGNIWSLVQTTSRRKGIIRPYINTNGYLRVNLYNHCGNVKHEYVHRLIALTFIPNPYNYPIVNHIDNNVANNCVENLEWCTQKHNIEVSHEAGRQCKDFPTKLTDLNTGTVKKFGNMKAASIYLFEKTWRLGYLRKQHGNDFTIGDWRVEIDDSRKGVVI